LFAIADPASVWPEFFLDPTTMTTKATSGAQPGILSLIHDSDSLPALDALPEVVVRRHRLGTDLSGLAETVIVALDLEQRDAVLRLREAWARFGKPRHLIFLVDRADHFAATQANALGAHHLLPAPLDIRALLALLRPQSVETLQAVASGAAALESMFSGLLSGSGLDAREVGEASADVLLSLHRDGLDGWLDAVRAHHGSTFQHCLVVTGVIANFGRATGMSHKDMQTLTVAGFLHDIGKIRIPLAILDKAGSLTREEFAAVKRHPIIGFNYLNGDPRVTGDVLSAVRHHHEYLDGSGYPDGLTSSAIDDLTRIMTVCDIYGAMVETRSYRPAARPSEAIAVLSDMAARGKVEAPLVAALARSVGVAA
jgi:HD-GYP domain-containing protein (c-di-GMP phosphodiesterase class II)